MRTTRVKYGSLLEPLGQPAAGSDFTLVPGRVRLDGDRLTGGFELLHYVGSQPPLVLRPALDQHYEAAWVRARIPVVFGFTPEFPRDAEKCLMDVGFVAVPPHRRWGYPFVCTDYYGRAKLWFSPDGPRKSRKAAIARAFWSLLLAEPDDLVDFEEEVCHTGVDRWLRFGCREGIPYCKEYRKPRRKA